MLLLVFCCMAVVTYGHEVGTVLNDLQDTVVATDPEACLAANGFLAGVRDCCSFIQCNAAEGNNTGIERWCWALQWWDDELKTCRTSKSSGGNCIPEEDCAASIAAKEALPARTECPSPAAADTCCVGQNDTFPGYEPVVEFDPNDDSVYKYNNDASFQSCPPDMVFNPTDCCCEYNFVPVAPCDGEGEFFEDPDNACCGFLRCWANRTGAEQHLCDPPSVWNQANSTCDLVNNVPACADADCGVMATEPACEGDQGECCRLGLWYNVDPTDDTRYFVINAPWGAADEANCCPVDMDGFQLIFNSDPESCCCELPA